jgi:hypothetical protein
LTPRAAARIFACLHPSLSKLVTRRRSARYALRRRKRTLRVVFWCCVGFVCLAFVAGFAWTLEWSHGTSEGLQSPSDSVQRSQALRLLDRAVEAKYNQLWSEATRFAFDARETDPATPGVDIFIGEMALERDDINVMGSAARAALRQQPASANAKLLLAIQAWILRGRTGASEAGAAATQTLQEAATDELSNGAVRFFAGDFLRAIGQPAEAHANLLGGLHRLHPWESSALIAAKLWLAVEEAESWDRPIAAVLSEPNVERFGSPSADLHRSIAGSVDVASAASALRRLFTAKQIEVLSRDPAFASVPLLSESTIGSFLPFADTNRLEILQRKPDTSRWDNHKLLESNNLRIPQAN